MKKILIGILVIDRPKTTRKCLQQLFKNTDRNAFVLCVVDNNSNDETKSMLQEYRKDIDVLIENPFNHGCAFSVNQYLALRMPGMHALDLNADFHILTDEWLPLMLKIIDYPDIGIVAGRRPDLFYDPGTGTEPIPGSDLLFSDPGRFQYYKANIRILKRDDIFLEWDIVNNTIIYPFAMMKDTLIDEIGGMNEQLGIDDINYSYRVKLVGKKCVYIPNAVGLQPHGAEPQNHPEYKANRELVMMNWLEYEMQIQNPELLSIYCGSRFIPGSISDKVYQRRSDANYEFFKNYKKRNELLNAKTL